MSARSQSGLNELRWRCRRGMKELDDMLVHYLDSRYEAAAESEQAAFRELLEVPDPDVFQLLVGKMKAANPAINDVIQAILAFDRRKA